ncbi:hypothetical protein COOONC_23784, partial [Cooperia oncophora]
MDLLEQCNLFHGNSFFTKKEDRRWTWESPNATTHSEIDHVLTNRKWSLLDVSVVDAFRTGSDHRLVRAKIRLRARIRRRDFFRPPPIRLPHYDTNAMETAAAHYTWQEAQDLSQDYTMLIEGLRHCAMASAITTRTDSNGRIDDKARALLQQRAVVHRNPASTPLERADAAPQIEEWEVEHALRQMKPGKAPGPDRISVDFLKSASRTVIKQLTRRYNRRKKCAWTAMGRIREAAQLISDRKIRAALFDSTVLPALCYASETWAENKASTLMLTRAQRALERTLLNINRREQRCRNLHSTDMRSMSGILDAVVYAWNAKKRWAGHVVRRTDDRWTTRITLWYPRDAKRK